MKEAHSLECRWYCKPTIGTNFAKQEIMVEEVISIHKKANVEWECLLIIVKM